MTSRNRINRFERVRATREKLRDEIQGRVAEVRDREQKLMDLSESLDRKRHGALKTFSEGSSSGSLSVVEIWSLRSAIESVDEDIREVNRSLTETREELRGLMEVLEERHRDAKAVDNLVSSLRETYRKEMLQAEQLEMDDLASAKFAMGRMGAAGR